MKKTVLALALLAASVASARAGELVMQSSLRGISVVGISITTTTPTSIVLGPNNGWAQACVQNLDLTAALYCGDTVSVSSLTANALVGAIVPPAVDATHPYPPTCFALLANGDFFCLSNSTTALSTRAVIIKAK